MLFIDIDIMISQKGIQDLLILSRAVQREEQELGVVNIWEPLSSRNPIVLAQHYNSLDTPSYGYCTVERIIQ